MTSPSRILTVGREFACGSGEVTRLLAQRLGWQLFDRELIDEIARAAHLDPGACKRADERVEGWFARLGRDLWSAAGEKGPALIPDVQLDPDAMARLTRQVIENLAAAAAASGQPGCIIVGRGANYILHERRDAFHVFLYAPHAWRLRHLAAHGQLGPEAEALLRRTDHERQAYIRRYFDQDWPRRQLYHLMVNTAIGPERSVAAITAALGVTSM